MPAARSAATEAAGARGEIGGRLEVYREVVDSGQPTLREGGRAYGGAIGRNWRVGLVGQAARRARRLCLCDLTRSASLPTSSRISSGVPLRSSEATSMVFSACLIWYDLGSSSPAA